jgi:glycosyltransferase involved in cell wall biosynthesis
MDFEWVVIDDGSTDNTSELVQSWIESALFPIRYRVQQNSGKHIAWNLAVSMSQGIYFMCLDSDDELCPNAVQVLHGDLHPKRGTDSEVASRAFLLLDSQGQKFGSDLGDVDLSKCFSQLVYEKKLPSDVWIVFLLEKIKRFPFPEKYKKVYFPEGFVISAFDKEYPIQFHHNQRLGIYHRDLNDKASNANSVTFKNLRTGSAVTLSMMHLGHLNYNMRFFGKYPVKIMVHAIHYIRFRLYTEDRTSNMIREINNIPGKLVALIASIPGAIAYVIDKVR